MSIFLYFPPFGLTGLSFTSRRWAPMLQPRQVWAPLSVEQVLRCKRWSIFTGNFVRSEGAHHINNWVMQQCGTQSWDTRNLTTNLKSKSRGCTELHRTVGVWIFQVKGGGFIIIDEYNFGFAMCTRSSIHGRANLQALAHDGALKAAAAESYCFCIPDVCRANGVLGRSSVRSPWSCVDY